MGNIVVSSSKSADGPRVISVPEDTFPAKRYEGITDYKALKLAVSELKTRVNAFQGTDEWDGLRAWHSRIADLMEPDLFDHAPAANYVKGEMSRLHEKLLLVEN